MINKVILIGNVGQDPEIRYTGDVNNGTKVATFRVATTERYRDRSGNLQEHTEWHSIVVWRNTADVVEKYVKKGTQVYIEGRLRSRSWDDQNGNKRYVTEIVADTLQLLGRRPEGQQQGGYQQQAPQGYQQPGVQQQPAYQQPGVQQPTYQPPVQQAQPKPAVEDLPEDDLPF
ncbi:MAG: single-stranded DNA-binding protein [Bacteroidales bacterium]|nr:single-stranded DNA-binding protein [Bacteroidales bacterium]